MFTLPKKRSGFTLVDMIIVIVITGIIGGMVAIFIRAPVQGYMDSARRAELTDIADTAMRRLARDVHTAVPNSLRSTNCTAPCVEFLPTKDGGRYRGDTGGNNNILVFGPSGTTQFDIVGTAMSSVTATTDFIVVGSGQPNGAPPFAYAYDQTAAGILRQVTNMTNGSATVTFAAPALPYLAKLSSRHFSVVDGTQRAVAYACEGLGKDANGNGTGQLKRYWNYGFNVAPSVNSAILANKVELCDFNYSASNQRFGLLAVTLKLTSGGESVTLYNEIHVNNVP